jgi:phage terminase large subunit
VHTLLRDQISLIGSEHEFDVFDTEISHKLTGSTFIFAGLGDQTASSIKSFEGIDICWIEEAQAVKRKSMDILIPTIRKAGSQIWVSFNPELDTDPAYQRFVLDAPPNSHIQYLTYRDNPWFTAELEAERAHDEKTKPRDEYEHIWLGKTRATVAGAVFAEEVATMQRECRIGILPYDPRLKVHVVFDMGYNTDAMAVGLWQRGPRGELRAIRYYEYRYQTVDRIAADLKMLRYNWGYVWMPWDAFVQSRQTGKTDADLMRAAGFLTKKVPRVHHEAQGVRIRALRNVFFKIYADAKNCDRLIECWKRYRRHVPAHGEPAAPIHDEYSHACDMSGYMAQVENLFTNENEQPPWMQNQGVGVYRPRDLGLGALG